MKILSDGTVQIRNKKTGETKVVDPKDLPNYGISYANYKSELDAYDTVTGSDTVASKTKTAEDLQKKKVTAEAAKQLVDVLNKKSSGELKGKELEDALNYAASNYNSNVAFGEGGKSLTDNERSVLAGKLVDQTEQGPNILEKLGALITGNKPVTKSKVASDDETIKNRALSAIQDYINSQGQTQNRLETSSSGSLSDDEILNLLK
jgi:hypothetical protein